MSDDYVNPNDWPLVKTLAGAEGVSDWKILVCGGRNYSDYEYLSEFLSIRKPTQIIQGGASGADSLAKKWAYENGISCIEVKADWGKHGRAAGPIRNRKMAKLLPHFVIAFPGGRGTENMILEASKYGIPIYRVPGREAEQMSLIEQVEMPAQEQKG